MIRAAKEPVSGVWPAAFKVAQGKRVRGKPSCCPPLPLQRASLLWWGGSFHSPPGRPPPSSLGPWLFFLPFITFSLVLFLVFISGPASPGQAEQPPASSKLGSCQPTATTPFPMKMCSVRVRNIPAVGTMPANSSSSSRFEAAILRRCPSPAAKTKATRTFLSLSLFPRQ